MICNNMIIRIGLLSLMGCLMGVFSVQAQSRCSVAMAQGTYAIECSGHATALEGMDLLPVIALGTVSLDGAGSVTNGTLNVSLGGMAGRRSIAGGSGVVNADCSGTLEVELEGLPSATVPGVILDQGNKILAFSPIPGTTAQCTLTRISLD